MSLPCASRPNPSEERDLAARHSKSALQLEDLQRQQKHEQTSLHSVLLVSPHAVAFPFAWKTPHRAALRGTGKRRKPRSRSFSGLISFATTRWSLSLKWTATWRTPLPTRS